MQPARRGYAERTGQHHLPGGRAGEVGTAHDVGDALGRIVDHHRELVGPQPVGALQHKIADLGGDVLLEAAAQPVIDPDRARRHAQPPGARRAPLGQTVAAGARIDEFAVTGHGLPGALLRVRDLPARAAAGIGESACDQGIERRGVTRAACRLEHRLAVGVQAEAGERVEDGRGRARLLARRIDVLDAQQPASAVCARIEPGGERRDRRPGVQRPGRGGGEAADVAAACGVHRLVLRGRAFVFGAAPSPSAIHPPSGSGADCGPSSRRSRTCGSSSRDSHHVSALPGSARRQP